MKELYSKLGFTEEESRLQGEEFQKLCKKKFRELSKQWHPDRWSNKSEDERKKAEEKFKEINEANEILSNPEKRQMYDMTGSTNGQFQGGGGGGFNPFEDFGADNIDPFDFFGRRRHRTPRGSDVQVNVTITLQEAFTGVKKTIDVPLEKPCSHCNGTGSADGKRTECPHCHGIGFISQIQRNGGFTQEIRQYCPYCGGTGEIKTNPCSHCHGTGKERTTVKKTIEIPAGIFTGAAINLEGQGNPPDGGVGRNGNLYVQFNVLPNPNYERVDNDIIYNLELTLLEAWDGVSKTVYNINGTSHKITIPALTKSGTLITVAQEGFNNLNFGGYGRGYFKVRIIYKMPKALTNEQVKLLEQFYNLENKK